jgi:hypothetical protein
VLAWLDVTRIRITIGAAPPRKRTFNAAAGVGLVVFLPLAMAVNIRVGLIGLAAVLFFMGKPVHLFNRDQFPKLMKRWENSYRCGRCETVYEAYA